MMGFLCFRGIHNSLPSIWVKLAYSRIKIDHIADSLLKLWIKIVVHLLNVELLQLLTLVTMQVAQLQQVRITQPHQSEFNQLSETVMGVGVEVAEEPEIVKVIIILEASLNLSSLFNVHYAVAHMKNMSLKFMQLIVKADRKTYRK